MVVVIPNLILFGRESLPVVPLTALAFFAATYYVVFKLDGLRLEGVKTVDRMALQAFGLGVAAVAMEIAISYLNGQPKWPWLYYLNFFAWVTPAWFLFSLFDRERAAQAAKRRANLEVWCREYEAKRQLEEAKPAS